MFIIKKCLDLWEDTSKLASEYDFLKITLQYFLLSMFSYHSSGRMRSNVTNDKTEKFSWSSFLLKLIHSFSFLNLLTAVKESLVLSLVCFTFLIYVHESWVTPFHSTLKHIMAESSWKSKMRTWKKSAAKIDIFTIILTMIWSRVDKWIRNAY